MTATQTHASADKDQRGQAAIQVLIVDDEPDVLAALSGTLVRHGFAVRTVSDGEAALAALKESAADVVITDVIMPSLSGLALVTTVRALYPATRLIAISGGGDFGPFEYKPDAITTSAYLAACERAGAHAVLAKPFEAWEIAALIHRVMGH